MACSGELAFCVGMVRQEGYLGPWLRDVYNTSRGDTLAFYGYHGFIFRVDVFDEIGPVMFIYLIPKWRLGRMYDMYVFRCRCGGWWH